MSSFQEVSLPGGGIRPYYMTVACQQSLQQCFHQMIAELKAVEKGLMDIIESQRLQQLTAELKACEKEIADLESQQKDKKDLTTTTAPLKKLRARRDGLWMLLKSDSTGQDSSSAHACV